MILHNSKCIYFHIGKTAGTAIETLLYGKLPHHMIENRSILFGMNRRENYYLQHATAETVLSLIGETTFNNYYKFTVVRNPFIRLVSVFYFEFEQHIKQFGSFNNFVLNLPKLITKPNHARGSHYLPQVRYAFLDDKFICHDLAYFEKLPRSLDQVRRRLGINKKLKRVNPPRSSFFPRMPVAELYDQEMIQIMLDVYGADFEAFGYPPYPLAE